MDWSTLRVVDLIDVTLISAGTLSPTRKQNGLRVTSSKAGKDTPMLLMNA